MRPEKCKRAGVEIDSGPLRFCGPKPTRLEDQLQAKLKCSRPALPKGWVRAGDIRGLRPETERKASSGSGRVGEGVIAARSAEDIGEVDTVQDVEAFGAQLRGEAFFDLELLGKREIPFIEREPTEVVASGSPERAESRRNENGTAVGIAAQGCESCNGSGSESSCLGVARGIGGRRGCCHGCRAVAGAGTREVGNAAGAAIGSEERASALEVLRVAIEIPPFAFGC